MAHNEYGDGNYDRGKERAIARNRQIRRGREAVKFDEQHPGLRDEINKATHLPSWIAQSLHQWGRLTDKQLAVAKKILAERGEREEQWAKEETDRKSKSPSWSTGRVEVEGVVRTAKWKQSQYGTALKALYVLDDGRLLWATVPESVLDGNNSGETDTLKWLRGKRIAMTVTVKPKDDDDTFGWGSRPSKARIV